ncbi:MAG: PEP-CTERM sorting domain-containing protein [Pseudomonadales bacterium]|nr:PEP-CTERM sorting domain-containing protein [Pseudomonadales bacterium]
MNKLLSVITLVCFTALTNFAAQATIVDFTLTGNIATGDPSGPYELTTGDTVSLEGSFDDALYTGIGQEIINFNQASNNEFDLQLGSGPLLNNTLDANYLTSGGPGTSPSLVLDDGVFLYLFFNVPDDVNNDDGEFFSGFFGFSASKDSSSITGSWSDFNIVTVPEPYTIGLFGLGLVAIGGFRQRRAVRG